MSLIALFFLLSVTVSAQVRPMFSFHLFSEPAQLDPQLVSSASGTYLQSNLFRGLFRYRSDRGLIPEMAKKCERTPLRLRCTLKDNIRWSDGKPIVSEDFVRAFQNVVEPDNKNLYAKDLFALKNAKSIWQGLLPVKNLGVRAESEKILLFEFAEEDYEFEYKLIHSSFVPRRAENQYSTKVATSLLVNGPYKVASWKQGVEVKLVSNKYYDSQDRPDVSVFFVDDDNTALRLYESGKLTFLRRLTAADVPRFKNLPDMHVVPMARFDYVGFSAKLKGLPLIRQALIKSIDFAQFRGLFFSSGTPGCPSFPEKWVDRVPCEKFHLSEAKKAWAEVGAKAKNLPWQFGISQMGGEDIARAAEWFQGQWSKNLGLRIPIQPMEQGSYLQKLKTDPPLLFRKGIGLDRPTCSAALEIFTTGNPENYIQLSDPEYDRIYQKLLNTMEPARRRQLCRQAVERLIQGHWIVPLGAMHFTMLANPRFKGWHVNEINQLDLTDLRLAQ